MSDIETVKSTRGRTLRPERINLGDDEAVRNDIIAKEQGASERAVNRGDAEGAPYLYIAGVKYRPIGAYRKFLAGKIRVRNQAAQRRRHTRISSKTRT